MSKKDNKISMPQTGAGLVRYFDEESVGPKLSPEHVLVATCYCSYTLFRFKIFRLKLLFFKKTIPLFFIFQIIC